MPTRALPPCHGAVRGVARHSLAWHSMAWRGMKWCGMAGKGSAWCGTARHGMAWHSMTGHSMARLSLQQPWVGAMGSRCSQPDSVQAHWCHTPAHAHLCHAHAPRRVPRVYHTPILRSSVPPASPSLPARTTTPSSPRRSRCPASPLAASGTPGAELPIGCPRGNGWGGGRGPGQPLPAPRVCLRPPGGGGGGGGWSVGTDLSRASAGRA